MNVKHSEHTMAMVYVTTRKHGVNNKGEQRRKLNVKTFREINELCFCIFIETITLWYIELISLFEILMAVDVLFKMKVLADHRYK